jgi:hypothetical protein
MRIDLEQFLALTMMLGTAGAIGAVVYVGSQDLDPEAAVSEPLLDEPQSETADASPEPAAAPDAPVVPASDDPPPLPAQPDADFLADPALDGISAPHFE